MSVPRGWGGGERFRWYSDGGMFVEMDRGGVLTYGKRRSMCILTRKSGVLGSIPGLATYFRFSFRFFKKGSCQLLAKVCA